MTLRATDTDKSRKTECVCACHLSTKKVAIGGSEVQRYPRLQSEFEGGYKGHLKGQIKTKESLRLTEESHRSHKVCEAGPGQWPLPSFLSEPLSWTPPTREAQFPQHPPHQPAVDHEGTSLRTMLVCTHKHSWVTQCTQQGLFNK